MVRKNLRIQNKYSFSHLGQDAWPYLRKKKQVVPYGTLVSQDSEGN